MDIHRIVNTLGRSAISDCVGVTPNAVTEALRAGAFPTSWYVAVTDLGAANGVVVPMNCFKWKSAITPTDITPPLSERENAVNGGLK